MSRLIEIDITDDKMCDDISVALSSKVRRNILRLLRKNSYTIVEIAEILNIPVSTAGFNINVLKKANLVFVTLKTNSRGNAKIISRRVDRVTIDMGQELDDEVKTKFFTANIPLGSYVKAEVSPGCGIASEKGIIIADDMPGAFYSSARFKAQMIWFAKGYIEYNIPNYFCQGKDIQSVSFSMEICSEAPNFRNDWPSDITFEDKHIKTVGVSALDIDNILSVNLNSSNLTYQAELWSPEHPALYDVKFTLKKCGVVIDEVGSYFGLREFKTKGNKVLLNNVPYYQKLVLDQGYWKDSHLTPPSADALIEDIQLSKQMGFNGARKHQKVEDERFLYYADVLGFLVWVEMPSPHWFNDEGMSTFTIEWQNIVRQNYNHPSAVVWVVYNESWGIRNISTNKKQQEFTKAMYFYTKAIDGMRPVISNDGWEHTYSDILTIHHYEQSAEKLFDFYNDEKKLQDGWCNNNQKLPYAEGYSYNGQPILFSEYGGTAFVGDTNHGWGYGNAVGSGEEFLTRYNDLMHKIKTMPNVCGFCYTQITDVQQEVNGLLDEERNVKTNMKELKKIADSI